NHESPDPWIESTVLPGLVEKVSHGIYIELDGRFAYLNEAAVRQFGASSPGALLGRSVLERVAPRWRPVAAERMRLARHPLEEVLPLEKQYVRLDGSVFDVEVFAEPIRHKSVTGAVVYFRDTSLDQEARDAERRSSALLHAVIEGTTDAIYVKDKESRLLLVNSAACRIAGKSAEDLLGHDDAAVFAPETAQAGMKHDRELMASRTTETREEELRLA